MITPIVTRYYAVYDFDGLTEDGFVFPDFPTSTDKVEDTTIVYATDHMVSYQETIVIVSGTRYYEYKWVHEDTDAVLGSVLWRTMVDGSSGYLHGWDTTTSTWVEFASSLTPSSEYNLESGILGLNVTEGLLGTYKILRIISEEGESGPEELSSEATGKRHDIRALVLHNVEADKPRFQPDSNEPTTTLRADVLALPVTTNLHGNWEPSTDVTWQIELFREGADEPELLVDVPFTGSFSPDYDDGWIGAIAQVWDGIRVQTGEDDELAECQFQATFKVLGDTPSTGNALTGGGCSGTCYRCRCHTDKLNGRVHTQFSPGPSFPALDYDSFSYEQAAASFGFGWSSAGSAKIIEINSGADLIYRTEGHAFMRWTLESGNYVPFFPDNPNNITEIEKSTSAPDYTYRVTFPDQTRREFDENGVLLRDVDRNDNELSYAYNGSGHIETISDGRGRVLYYEYGSRTDGQPEAILLNDDDPETARQVQFAYYEDNEDEDSPDSINRLKTITNPVGDVVKFLYFPFGPLKEIRQVKTDQSEVVVVAYTYDSLGRVATEERYGETRRTYGYFVDFINI